MSSPTTASASSSSEKISLRISDNKILLVDKKVAILSLTIKKWMEDHPSAMEIPPSQLKLTGKNWMKDHRSATEIPVSQVKFTDETMAKVIGYCQKHDEDEDEDGNVVKNEEKKKEHQAWEREYINIDPSSLEPLLMAASYLNVDGLLTLCAQTMGDMVQAKVRSMRSQDFRAYFKLGSDFSPEEELMDREFPWAFS